MNESPDADGIIDDIDVAVLGHLAALYTTVDPVPDGLVQRIQFAMALEELDVEVLRLVDETATAGARGDVGRIYTFQNAGLDLTVRVAGRTGDTLRIDGWLAPPAAYRIVLRAGGRLLERTADPDGRFVFERVPAGPARIFIRPHDGTDPHETALATPEVVL
jgi:hypothetical protein